VDHNESVSLRPGEAVEASDTPNGMFGPYGGLDMHWMLQRDNINRRARPKGVLQVILHVYFILFIIFVILFILFYILF
jgi:hypothetical protein